MDHKNLNFKSRSLAFALAAALLTAASSSAQNDFTINVNTKPAGLIDEKIYGQLFEHIYYSANNGVWQEIIRERSFEPEHFPGISPRDGYFDGWFVDDENILHSPTRYEQPLNVAEVDATDFDITMQVDWRAYLLARRLWSGGMCDIRISFGKTADGQPIYFRIHDPYYEGRRETVAQTEEQIRAYNEAKAREKAQQQPTTAYFSFAMKQTKEVPGWGGRTRKVEVLEPFAQKIAGKGQITSGGSWNYLKIKIRGRSVSAEWNEKNVLSGKLPEGCTPMGMVTLWENSTETKYRDISITGAKTKNIIFRGMPKDVQTPQVAQEWTSYGNGCFMVEKGDAVNMKYAQKITAQSGAVGVKQGPQHIESDNPYIGSIYAKGDGRATLSIVLRDGQKVVANATLGMPGSNWHKYDFTLDSKTYNGDVDFCIEVEGGSVLVDQVSLTTKQGQALGGFRPDIYNKVKDLGVSCMRWPGGGYAAQYDWRWGIGPQENRQRWAHWQWMDYDQNCFGTDEFVRFCREMKSEPIIVVSVGYDRPACEYEAHIENAVNWLRYCNEPATGEWGKKRAANGHPAPYNVKYWEIDNEMWEMGIERYEKAVRDFSTALRKADPSIKIIVCGGFREDEDFLNRSANYFDYMSLHHYEQQGGYLTGPKRLEEQAQRYAQMIANCPNPNIKLYYSEWNLQSIDWRTGLFAAGFLNMCERNPIVELGAAALFIRRTDMPDWNNAFINFDYKDVFVAPNYQVTKLWRDHFSKYRLDFSGDTGDLSVSATLSENGRSVIVKLANATDKEQTLTIKGDWKEINGADYQYYAPGDLMVKNSMENKDAVQLKTKELTPKEKALTVVMEPYSVGVATIRL